MSSHFFKFFLIVLMFTVSSKAQAFRAGLATGSVGFGGGHSGPADPYSPTSYKAHITFRNSADLSLSVSHLLIGKVFRFKSGAYVIPAVGSILGSAGTGLGLSSTFGFDFICWGLCLYSEFQQQLGSNQQRKFLSGYSMRIGIDYTTE